MFKITNTELEKFKKGLEDSNHALARLNATANLSDDDIIYNEAQMTKNTKLIKHLDSNYLKITT